jgi:predicted ATP-grasp superfamily ATP-dependent carboligase
LARFSRSLHRFVKKSTGLTNEELPQYLAEIAESHQLHGSVLFPMSDEQVRLVSQKQAKLAQYYVLTTPGWETVQFLYDKRLTYELALRTGVAIPSSHVLGNSDGLAGLDLEFPVVIKPASTARFLKVTNKKAWRANDREELQRLYVKMSEIVGSSAIIIQELLPGPSRNLFSFAGYFRDGEPLVGLSVKRSRQLPQDFGRSSTLVESIEIPELSRLSARLLRSIRYTGLAEVEFMWNVKRERFELLEVNPRLWAWHGLAIAAGLDLPYVAFAQAVGINPIVGSARHGVKWVRFLTDVRAAMQGIYSGAIGLREYLFSLRGITAFAVFSPSDPLPSIVEPFLLLLNSFSNSNSQI